MKGFGLGMTDSRVNPAPGVESDGVHPQNVTLPRPDSITQPTGLRVLRKRAPIDEDLTERGIGGRFIENDDQLSGLDDLEWGNSIDPGYAGREAPRQGVVFMEIGLALL